MEKVYSSQGIVEIAGNKDTSGKLNMWASIIKWIIIIVAAFLMLAGIVLWTNSDTRPLGVMIIVLAIIQACLAFFYVYILRALAIITEAASIIVLEHQQNDEESAE